MWRSCEGFQPGTPLRQPAPAAPFVPCSLRCSPGPAASPQPVRAGRTLPGAPRCPSPGPAATAICSRAGGRTTPPWGPGPSGAVGHGLAPSGRPRCHWAPGLPQLPQPPLQARTPKALSALLPSGAGAACSPDGFSSLKPKAKRESDGPTPRGDRSSGSGVAAFFFSLAFKFILSPRTPAPFPHFVTIITINTKVLRLKRDYKNINE